MLAPVHTKNTARMGSAPVNNAPVKDPKNFGAPGAKVASSAPARQGHHHHAAGTRSSARLMGICVILPSPAGAVSVAP